MSLKVWLPLNKDLRNNGSSGVVVTNFNVTISGGCATFNGSSYMQINGINVSKAKKLSVCCWVKPTNANVSNIWGINYTGSWWQFTAGSSNYLRVRDNGGGATGSATDCAFGTINAGQWIHICCTYNSGTVKIYKDGVLYSTNTTSGTALVDGITEYWIGQSQPGNLYNGDLRDFRIYNHCLSQKEVSELARGLVAHYKLSDEYVEGTENLVSNNNLGQYYSTYQTLAETYNGQPIIRCTGTSSTNSGFAYYTNGINVVPGGSLTYSIYLRYNSVKISFASYHAGRINGTYHDPIISKSISSNSTVQNVNATEKTTIYNENRTKVINWNDIEIGKWYFIETILTNNVLSDTTISFANFYFLGGTNAGTWDITCPQIELKDHATPYTPSTRVQGKIIDYSGMGNNLPITGTAIIASGSARYDKCFQFNGSTYANVTALSTQTAQSASFWYYCPSTVSSTGIIFLDRASLLAFGFWDSGNEMIVAATNACHSVYSTTNLVKNAWNHIVILRPTGSSQPDLYVNGLLQSRTDRNDCWGGGGSEFIIGNRTTATNYPFTGKIVDFRMFTKILTEDDILNLYHDSLSINNLQGSHCWEYIEDDTMTDSNPVNAKKTGVVECKKLSEAIVSFYDKETYVEPDGSVWIRIFHHNNPSTGLFSSGDTFTTKVYKDDNRWFQMSVCNYVTKWELMVKQKTTSGSTELKGRWIQNANPMTATHDEVTTNRITINTSSGYSNFSSGTCGIICRGTSYYSYICQTTDSGSGWWGGIGEFTAYNGGIERFALQGASGQVTTGYLDLYLRIDNLDDITVARIGKEGLISDTITEL